MKLIAPEKLRSYGKHLWEKHKRGQPVSFADIFGCMVGETLLGKQNMKCKLSDFRSRLSDFKHPMFRGWNWSKLTGYSKSLNPLPAVIRCGDCKTERERDAVPRVGRIQVCVKCSKCSKCSFCFKSRKMCQLSIRSVKMCPSPVINLDTILLNQLWLRDTGVRFCQIWSLITL